MADENGVGGGTPASRQPLSKSEQELALAAMRVGQQMGGHNPSEDRLERAARVLAGTTTVEDAVAEIDGGSSPAKQSST